MFGTFFRGCRITWRLFRSLPTWLQRFLAAALVVAWVLVILGTYGLAGTAKKDAAARAAASPSAMTSDGSSPGTAGTPTVPAPATTPVTVTSSPAATTRIPGLARGCLGGVNPTTAVFTAQKEAPLTPEGAAEFAASYTRWMSRYPHIGDPKEQGKQLWTADATALVRQAGNWPANMPETSVYASLLNSHFKVTDYTKTSAVVSLTLDAVSTKATGTETETQSMTFKLKSVDGHWRVSDSTTVLFTPDQLRATGQAFAGAC